MDASSATFLPLSFCSYFLSAYPRKAETVYSHESGFIIAQKNPHPALLAYPTIPRQLSAYSEMAFYSRVNSIQLTRRFREIHAWINHRIILQRQRTFRCPLLAHIRVGGQCLLVVLHPLVRCAAHKGEAVCGSSTIRYHAKAPRHPQQT